MVTEEIIKYIKKKKEFSELPNSIISRAAELNEGDVKETRAFLRKYFGVFLTNKILKGKGEPKEMLRVHISSRKRDYEKLYKKIFENIGFVDSVIDLGAGVNGLSIHQLHLSSGMMNYYGIEAAGQIVDIVNRYFDENCEGFDAHMIQGDLFNLNEVKKIVKDAKEVKVIFMFQIIDALENLEKDFSKKLILELKGEANYFVITLPTESLGGRRKFMVNRKWIIEFLKKNFEILNDFEMNGERILVLKER